MNVECLVESLLDLKSDGSQGTVGPETPQPPARLESKSYAQRTSARYLSEMTARELFRSNEAVLEYRPVRKGDGWDWYWTLLSLPLEDASIASGVKDSRGGAALEARLEARRAGRKIARIRIRHHALGESTVRQKLFNGAVIDSSRGRLRVICELRDDTTPPELWKATTLDGKMAIPSTFSERDLHFMLRRGGRYTFANTPENLEPAPEPPDPYKDPALIASRAEWFKRHNIKVGEAC